MQVQNSGQFQSNYNNSIINNLRNQSFIGADFYSNILNKSKLQYIPNCNNNLSILSGQFSGQRTGNIQSAIKPDKMFEQFINQITKEVFSLIENIVKDLFTFIKKTLHQALSGNDNSAAQFSDIKASDLETSDIEAQDSIDDIGSTDISIDGSNEFLWKPVSEKDGNLAILIPSQYTGEVESVSILSSNKKQILAEGKASGIGNENREHYRFSKAGGQFPNGSKVEITLVDGEKIYINIAKTGSRLTK